jgi:hypothetical protein
MCWMNRIKNKILRGAKPGELPVGRPTRLEFGARESKASYSEAAARSGRLAKLVTGSRLWVAPAAGRWA